MRYTQAASSGDDAKLRCVNERKLRYDERKRLSETGSLGEFSHAASPAMRNALWYVLFEPKSLARQNYIEAVELVARPYFGWAGDVTGSSFIASAAVDRLLAFVEIAAEKTGRYRNTSLRNSQNYLDVLPDFEARFNEICEIHRFGYRIEGGDIRMVGSPALDEFVVGPTLLAASRPGWEQVDQSYREALDHQRGGETDDALTAAHAAVEAALKAVGMTGQFGAMTKQFRNSDLVPTYLRQAPEALDALMTLLGKSNAIRSTHGDAHGKAPGAEEVPQALANLGIYWAGAFILYLAEVTR